MPQYQAAAVGRSTHCEICGGCLSFHQQWAGDICDDWRCRWTRLNRESAAQMADVFRQDDVDLVLAVPG